MHKAGQDTTDPSSGKIKLQIQPMDEEKMNLLDKIVQEPDVNN